VQRRQELAPLDELQTRIEHRPGRVLLRRTKYHVDYRVRGDVLEVLAVWHGARGVGPGL